MWIIFAILNPVTESIRSLVIKKTTSQVDPMILTWANNIIPVIVFPFAMYFAGVEVKSSFQFWYGFTCAGIIQIIASVLYMQAIAKGDISSVIPMLSFTPLFLLLFGPLIIGEFPGLTGLAGVLLVVAGSYLLNLDFKKKDILEPFKAIIRNKGTRLMLIVAILWSISGAFDKISINNSSVLQHITFTNVLIFIVITITLIVQKKFDLSVMRSSKKNLLLVSGLTTASYFFHYSALALTLVAYVIALKRTAGVFSVILGAVFLKESNLRQRLIGSIIMFLGVLLILFS
jgi:uncharacterized membrane protein